MALPQLTPGLIALFGSGETAASSGVAYEQIVQSLAPHPQIAILETPAGFQPNAARVAGKVADFLRVRLQNYHPSITQVAARARGTPFSPDDPAIIAPLNHSTLIFLGPGSPTYTIRQLTGSLAWRLLQQRHQQGAALITASAATIALGTLALPVYEIYKVGADLGWQPGLDFFGLYGLSLALVPHWNNTEGGAELDTQRCYMGMDRFEQLLRMLPVETTVVGIDEHTVLLIDLSRAICRVLGRGGVTLLHAGDEQYLPRGTSFAIGMLGSLHSPMPASVRGAALWEQLEPQASGPPSNVQALVEQRQMARDQRDWVAADGLRREIAALGWQVRDTPAGPVLEPAG